MAASKDYFLDLDVDSGPSLPTFSGSGYSTPRPSMSMSRRGSRPSTGLHNVGLGSSPPPPMPSFLSSSPLAAAVSNLRTERPGEAGGHDGRLVSDSREFSSHLQASLVAEALRLRGEMAEKHKFIDDLEAQLKAARDERDDFKAQVDRHERDSRNLRRQFQELEQGTLAALEQLAKERDSANACGAEIRSRFEVSQAKVKTLVDDYEKRDAGWKKEKSDWEAEKRDFERRVHVTETRLKSLLGELAAQHAAFDLMDDLRNGEHVRDSGLGDESDTESAHSSLVLTDTVFRTPSRNSGARSSLHSMARLRFSMQSPAGHDAPKTAGKSLAEELLRDEEEEDEEDETESADRRHESLLSSRDESRIQKRDDAEPRARHHVAPRFSQSESKAMRVFGVSTPRRRTLSNPLEYEGRPSSRAVEAIEPKAPARCVDCGTQYSPPPSPMPAPQAKSPEKLQVVTRVCSEEQIGANQRKKRVTLSTPQLERISTVPEKEPGVMVSSATQTTEGQLPTPPVTPKATPPKVPSADVNLRPVAEKFDMSILSTQDDSIPSTRAESMAGTIGSMTLETTQQTVISQLIVPSIAIRPPTSDGTTFTDRTHILPPGHKSVSTQTTKPMYEVASTAVQTEEILTQKRLQKLPSHLMPWNVSSNPPSPEQAEQRARGNKGPRILKPKTSPGSTPAETWYHSDNSPLGLTEQSAPRIPSRKCSVPGGLNEGEPESSTSYATVFGFAGTPRGKGTRPFPSLSTPSVPEGEENDGHLYSVSRAETAPSHNARGPLERGVIVPKGKRTSFRNSIVSNSTSNMRRSALIQNGASAHQTRIKSAASFGSLYSTKSVGPPFPVPDRSSSRKMFHGAMSDGAPSPTPQYTGPFRNHKYDGRNAQRDLPNGSRDSLRKVRSAAAIQRSSFGRRHRSSSPPSRWLGNTDMPSSLPQSRLSMPRSNPRTSGTSFSEHAVEPEQAVSQGTIVDAIADAMVGEWMWKYVRRRRSSGKVEESLEAMRRPDTDGSVNVTGTEARHKRWVWLSPYERAVMWSSKQPTTISALMGKSGRKLIIQSVLDVRDDTPLPKNHGISEPFYRSILILTPSRALKFTATSRDRHNNWLTALSFLAQSSFLTSSNMSFPAPPEEPHHSRTTFMSPRLNQSRIHDSVRISKDKARQHPGVKLRSASANATPTIPEWNGSAESILDAAEAPTIPRFLPEHGRYRSASGSRLPHSALRSMGYRDYSAPGAGSMRSSTMQTSVSSEVSSAFTHSIEDGGTMRMSAFIQTELPGAGQSQSQMQPQTPARRNGSGGVSGSERRTRVRSMSNDGFLAPAPPLVGRRRGSQVGAVGAGVGRDPRRSGVVFGEEMDAFDPFKGF